MTVLSACKKCWFVLLPVFLVALAVVIILPFYLKELKQHGQNNQQSNVSATQETAVLATITDASFREVVVDLDIPFPEVAIFIKTISPDSGFKLNAQFELVNYSANQLINFYKERLGLNGWRLDAYGPFSIDNSHRVGWVLLARKNSNNLLVIYDTNKNLLSVEVSDATHINLATHTSDALKDISFSYPFSWNLTPAINESDVIVLKNTSTSEEITLSFTDTFNPEGLWSKINADMLPQKDQEGNDILYSETFYTNREGTLSLRQISSNKIMTDIPYGATLTVIQINTSLKNPVSIIDYHELIESFQHNVREIYP